MTDSIDQEDQPIESRRIEQYPTVGPGLVVHWYLRSIVIEVDDETWDAWVVTDVRTTRGEARTSTVVRLERR